ncbi:MAG: dephospho-CoA kinase [Proteobacteria bacterium]|nr:dephospho-CoA kinase [Pseudomonadota bacterium]
MLELIRICSIWRSCMKTIGLTGGIGSGKSSVARWLKNIGYHVVDSDQLARDVVEPGSEGLNELVSYFGTEILTAQGVLDRKKLGQVVFDSPEKRKALEAILHPKIFALQTEKIKVLGALGVEVVFIEAALMVETGSYRFYNSLIVVYCSAANQAARIMKRDGSTQEEAQTRINAQAPTVEKVKIADLAIENNGTLADLHTKLDKELLPFIQNVIAQS